MGSSGVIYPSSGRAAGTESSDCGSASAHSWAGLVVSRGQPSAEAIEAKTDFPVKRRHAPIGPAVRR